MGPSQKIGSLERVCRYHICIGNGKEQPAANEYEAGFGSSELLKFKKENLCNVNVCLFFGGI